MHHLSLFANHLSFSSQHIFGNPTVTIEDWKDFFRKVEMVKTCVLSGSGDPAAKGMFSVDTSTWQAGAAPLLMLQRSAGSKVQSPLTN